MLFVAPGGNDSNDGASWAAAKRTINGALQLAAGGDEVWVAAGVYRESVSLGGVALYGGFVGNETSRDQRDWRRNRTQIAGAEYGQIASVVINTGENGSAVIDGFVVTSGNQAILCQKAVRVAIRNCAVLAGRYTYGIQCPYAEDITIQDCSIAAFAYPALNIGGGNSLTLLRNSIISGSAAAAHCSMNISLVAAGNYLTGHGGGLLAYSNGAAMTVVNNTAVGCGNAPAIWLSGTGAKTVANNIACYSRYGLSVAGDLNTVRNNCVYGNTTANYYHMLDLTGIDGNISVDPELEGGATTPQMHIQPYSPCREAGFDAAASATATDLDGQARFQGSHVDIGADESHGESWSTGPIWFVSPTGSDANTGTSWGKPLASIQTACDRGGDVWVAAGEYFGDVYLRSGVKLYGGFGGWECGVSQRRFRQNAAIIRGTVRTDSAGVTGARVDGFTLGGHIGVECTNSSLVIANNLIRGLAGADTNTGIVCTNCPNVDIKGNVISSVTNDGVVLQSSAANLTGNTIVGANYRGVFVADPMSACTLANNLIARCGSAGVVCPGTPGLLFYNNCVSGNGSVNYSGVPEQAGTNGNIADDPWLDSDGIHLMPGSPCIDAGSDAALSGTVDTDSQPRVRGYNVDIGADECYGEVWQSPVITYVSTWGNDSLPGDSWATAKKTITAAIDTRGGEIWVAAGTYEEHVRIKSGVMLFGGFAGNESSRVQRDLRRNRTAIAGGAATNIPFVMWESSYVKPGARLDGFAIIGRKAAAHPAIAVSPTPAMVMNNTITGHGAYGIHCSGGAPVIVGNTVVGNNMMGIYCYNYKTASIVGNIIARNSGHAIYAVAPTGAAATIANNLISWNVGTGTHPTGGIFVAGTAQVTNNTIVRNTAASGTGVVVAGGGSIAIRNNIIALNSGAIYGTPAVVRNNCVYGNGSSGTLPPGNIAVDPELASEACGNLRLVAGSPCIDAGDDMAVGGGWTDIDGQARIRGEHVDIGADEFYAAFPPPSPIVVRVSPDGSDSNDGSSWASPVLTVQAALERAAMLGGEVWVKAGTYNERVNVWPGTFLYGGFAGVETERGERDWNANVTILDGGGVESVVTFIDAGCACGVDGFTIQNGAGTRHPSKGLPCGGGVFCWNSSPLVANNVIARNGVSCQYGGGMYAGYGKPVVSGNIFTANTASEGSAIFGDFTGCVFTGNTVAGNIAGSGSVRPAVVLLGSKPEGAIAANNIVAFNPCGIYCQGGRNNCVYGNTEQDYYGSPGQGDVQADPLFVDRAAGDYRLLPNSPCIDAGWNQASGMLETDFAGIRRILGRNVDIGVYEFPTLAAMVADAKRSIDGTPVDMQGMIVTAAFDGCLYVETDDRSCGIRVEMAGHTVTEGMRVHVVGKMATNADGERYVAADSIVEDGSGAVGPLCLDARSLGGADWWLDSYTGAGQRGAGLKLGPNNIGLLVTIVGQVLSSGNGLATIQDGSGNLVEVISESEVTWPADSDWASFTGVCSLRNGTPVVRIRKQADVVEF